MSSDLNSVTHVLLVFFLNFQPKEHKKQLQLRKAITLLGMGILQREAPNQLGVTLFLPYTQQVGYIASLFGSHEGNLYIST